MNEREAVVTVRVKVKGLDIQTRDVWEFLNSDGFWVSCFSEDHAKQAAGADGPGKYRKTTTLTQHSEYALKVAGMNERDKLIEILERDDLYYDTGSHLELSTSDAAAAIIAAGWVKGAGGE